MEEEINYSEVIFKNSGQRPRAKKEEQVIYSEVNIKAPASQESTPPRGATNVRPFRLLAVSTVTLCILLLAAIALIIYFVVMMDQQRADLSDISAKNQQLITERNILENTTQELIRQKSILENKTSELRRNRDSLMWTMEQIKKFKNFPVNKFCLKQGCQPCLTGWIQFQEKCYFFYNQSRGWKTWTQSQTYCKDSGSDLVVIETLQEQEFISKNIHTYHDKYHGFWIGLKQDSDQNWIWVNGRKDTLGFWLDEDLGKSGPYAHMIPGRPLNASWDTSDNPFELKFICESELMIKSF
ncbi:asialoglycoprotein receptor 2-like [Sphaeramia orbicularis]|uniref:Asialoglycoprotein receptor 2-like n=1 Tax=Sphaeramia orbicularis TaxID=375764 RepID=A0A673BG97_9TELE|nr:asialoglycoprotein receptor 2-like [Sphaeramia orbicularis]